MESGKSTSNIDPRRNISTILIGIDLTFMGEAQRVIEIFDDGQMCWRYRQPRNDRNAGHKNAYETDANKPFAFHISEPLSDANPAGPPLAALLFLPSPSSSCSPRHPKVFGERVEAVNKGLPLCAGRPARPSSRLHSGSRADGVCSGLVCSGLIFDSRLTGYLTVKSERYEK